MSQDYEIKHMQDRVNPKLLKPASWLAQVDFINHLLLFNNVMLVALAEKQGGKSSYIDFLLQQLLDTFDIYRTDCKIHCEEKDITTPIARQLNLAKPERSDLMDICRQVNERNHHTLIILDDAHNLPEQLVKKMLDIMNSQAQTPYFHLILVSDYSLLPYLNQLSKQDNQEQIHSIEIGAFSHDEIQTYLHQTIDNDRFKSLVNKANCERFYQLTNGVIARMNREADPFFASLVKSGRKLVKRLGVGAALAASVVAGFVSLQLWQNPELLPVNYHFSQKQSQHIAAKMKQPLPIKANKGDHYQAISEPELFAPSVIAAIPAHSMTPDYQSVIAMIDRDIWREKINKSVLPHLNVARLPVNSRIVAHRPIRANRVSKRKDRPDFTVNATVTAKTKPVEHLAESNVVKIPLIKHKTPTKKAANPKYTIQLVATHQLKFLKVMLAKHPVHALKVYAYPIKQNGDQWYVLTAGRFANWSDAHDALANLPEAYQAFQPWIRPIDKA